MYLKIQGLVLRRTEYKDHDVLLTLLTRDGTQELELMSKEQAAHRILDRLAAM